MNALKTGSRAATKVIVTAACLCVILMSASTVSYATDLPRARPTTGKIIGVIQIEGAPPKLEPLKIIKDQDVCKEVPNESLIVGPGQGLQNVVVSLEGQLGSRACFALLRTGLASPNTGEPSRRGHKKRLRSTPGRFFDPAYLPMTGWCLC
jgi:hypothetical protein